MTTSPTPISSHGHVDRSQSASDPAGSTRPSRTKPQRVRNPGQTTPTRPAATPLPLHPPSHLAFTDLGRLVAHYPPRPAGKRLALLALLCGLVITVIFAGVGADWYYYGYAEFGPVAAIQWSQAWFLMAAIAAGSTFTLLLGWGIRLRYSADIHQSGLSIHAPLRPSLLTTWREITGITSTTTQDCLLGRPVRTRQQVVIYRISGKPIRLDQRIHQLSELTTHLKAHVYPRLSSEMRLALQAGETLSFGPLLLQPRSIHFGHKEIPWEQVSRVTVQSGSLVVESNRQNGFRLHTNRIPNLELLLQFIQQETG